MPIDKVSLSDPFAFQNSDSQTILSQAHIKQQKRPPKTIVYAKMTANSENDLVYIRHGHQQSSGDMPVLDPISQTDFPGMRSKTALPAKRFSIGSKNYFMPRMIIACEKLDPIKPSSSKKLNQSLPSEE